MSRVPQATRAGADDEVVRIDGVGPGAIDTGDVFRAWTEITPPARTEPGGTVVVSPVPERVELYDYGGGGENLYYLSTETAPDGWYWCVETLNKGEAQAAVFVPDGDTDLGGTGEQTQLSDFDAETDGGSL